MAQQIRPLLTEHGRFPTRRTWERRFAKLPARLPALLGCLGRHLVTLLRPWAAQGHAAAVDSTPLRAHGGVWHKKQRLAGEVPQTSIDTAAAWSTSGYHGWWYGWKRPLAVVVGRVWIPWRRSVPSPVPPTTSSPPRGWSNCRWRSGMFSVRRIITPPNCARHVRCRTGNSVPRAVAHIRIEMEGSQYAGSFISDVHWLSSRSTACSKTSLHGVVRCRSKACRGANCSP